MMNTLTADTCAVRGIDFVGPIAFRSGDSVKEQTACFVVRDHDGQALAYVYFEDEPGRGDRRRNCSRGMKQGGSR